MYNKNILSSFESIFQYVRHGGVDLSVWKIFSSQLWTQEKIELEHGDKQLKNINMGDHLVGSLLVKLGSLWGL